MLEVKGIRFGYSKRQSPVLDGVDLRLNSGETGVLLGRNGAGKTTLFSCLLGIVRPWEGAVTLDGEPVTKMSRREIARRIAYVPQNITLGGMTVFDTVLSGRVARFGVAAGKRDRDAASAAIEEMGLAEVAYRDASTLSGGEKQKTAVARALAQEPKLMIFDEPTGNLDISNSSLVISIARRIADERSIAVLTAMHDLNLAYSFGDRFFFLKDGAVFRSGGRETITPENVRLSFGAEIRLVESEGRTYIIQEALK